MVKSVNIYPTSYNVKMSDIPAYSVRALVADPALGTRVLAGSAGLDRTVLWAHASEIPDPDRWLGPHELLMTIGLCVPSGSAAQRQFIARLDDAGLAGVTIGEDGLAPHVTKAMLAEADARQFPVLATGGNVPFAVVGRTVAAANTEQQTMAVLQLARLYQSVGRQDHAGRRSGDYLRDLVGAVLSVVDDATGCVVIGPGVLRSESTRSYALRSSRPTHLLIDGSPVMDGLLLAHLTQVLAVEATSILQSAVERSEIGARLVDGILAERPDAIREGQRILVDAGSVCVLAVPRLVSGQVELAIALAEIVVLGVTAEPGVTAERDTVIIATPSAQVPRLREILSELGLPAGASAPHPRVEDLSSAAEQARSELTQGLSTGEPWREYRGAPLSLLTRSDTEARQTISAVLGPLAEAGARSTMLRDTLFALLDHDLRWGATSESLGIHRQTLVHRMQRVEEFTGRSVRSTAHVSEFWLARTAWKRLHPDERFSLPKEP